jgi:CRISPR-associated protein Cmr1
MRRLEYQVSFMTPAFLGNVEQAGQWRTPPFEVLSLKWVELCFEGNVPDE